MHAKDPSNPADAHFYLVIASRDSKTKVIDNAMKTIVWSTTYGLKQQAEQLIVELYEAGKDYSVQTGWATIPSRGCIAGPERKKCRCRQHRGKTYRRWRLLKRRK